jgi:hypothetical protein
LNTDKDTPKPDVRNFVVFCSIGGHRRSILFCFSSVLL